MFDKLSTFEIYKDINSDANTRNLVQNSASTITDNRKFYGLGFKVGL